MDYKGTVVTGTLWIYRNDVTVREYSIQKLILMMEIQKPDIILVSLKGNVS